MWYPTDSEGPPMTRLLSVARSSVAWPLSLIGLGLFTVLTVGCAGSLSPDLLNGGGSGGTSGDAGNLPPGCANATAIFMAGSHGCTTVCHTTVGAPAFGGFDMQTAGWEKNLV